MSIALRRAWDRTLVACGRQGDAASDQILDDLMARYGEPQRHYHGQRHLVTMFTLLGASTPEAARHPAVRCAVMWHDAIYQPGRPDNEILSAELAASQMAQLAIPTALIAETGQYILASAFHINAPALGPGDAFLDADLAILGADSAVYDDYAAQLREEYRLFDDVSFASGRADFLQKMLDAPQLFRTASFRGEFEARARANMARELAGLPTATAARKAE